MGFFDGKQPAAILKHAIMDQYIDPFVGMTGSRSPGGRVAVIDGYAGEGRYESGEEASPALLMRKARHLIGIKRRLECHFVEGDSASATRLRQVIENEGGGLPVSLREGNIEKQLGALLAQVRGVPLLVFLDPFGLMIPFGSTANVFAGRPSGVATELLINFNASGLRRMAGLLDSDKYFPGRETSLARMDTTCGGDWWRKAWRDHADDRTVAEEAVATGYARSLAKAAGCGWWVTPVRNRARHMPVYYLVFLTRHRDGFSEFGEALSRGLAKWREALHYIENADTLFGDEAEFKRSEEQLAAGWIDEIEQNLRRLLANGQPFSIFQRYGEVYGSATGQAREMHLRKAWKRLYPEITRTEPKGKLVKAVIEPA
jgi:three-Cys-motif partner protein